MTIEQPVALRSEPTWAGQLAILLIISVAVRVAFLLIKPASVYSLDVLAWQHVVEMLAQGANPYPSGVVNWLPVWPATLGGLGWISRQTDVSFVTLLFGLLILVESILLVVTFRLLCRFVSPRTSRDVLLFAIGLNPAAISQVTQHGNFDVLFMLWVMLAIGAMTKFQQDHRAGDWLAACAWLGLGVLTKTIPLAIAPLLAIGARRMPRPVLVAGAALLLFSPLAGLAIIYPLDPQAVWDNVITYHSFHGYFGLSGFAAMVDGVEFPEIGVLGRWHARIFLLAFPLALMAMALLAWRGESRRAWPIGLMTGLIFNCVISFGIGFGSQHIYWVIPPLAVAWGEIDEARWRRILLVGCCVIGMTYAFEYLILPSHGALLRTYDPQSEWLYRLMLPWLRAADQTILRLPMFCVFVAILIEGIRILRRPLAKA